MWIMCSKPALTWNVNVIMLLDVLYFVYKLVYCTLWSYSPNQLSSIPNKIPSFNWDSVNLQILVDK